MGEFPREQVLGVLAAYQISIARRADPIDPTEEVILVSTEDFGRVDISQLTGELMKVLPGRKVWVAPDGSKWKSSPV